MDGEEEVVAVLDWESLAALRRVMGVIFGVGVRSQVSARWCAVNSVRAVQQCDVLNAVCPPSRVEMDQVRLVLGKHRSRLTCDEKLLLCRRRNMITFKYDPLLTVLSIAIVFTRMMIGKDNDVSNILRSISHNHLVDTLANPACCSLVVLEVDHMFDYNNRSYHFSSQAGDIVTAHDTLMDAEINIRSNLCSNIR
jgi:hypothetical protein